MSEEKEYIKERVGDEGAAADERQRSKTRGRETKQKNCPPISQSRPGRALMSWVPGAHRRAQAYHRPGLNVLNGRNWSIST